MQGLNLNLFVDWFCDDGTLIKHANKANKCFRSMIAFYHARVSATLVLTLPLINSENVNGMCTNNKFGGRCFPVGWPHIIDVFAVLLLRCPAVVRY